LRRVGVYARLESKQNTGFAQGGTLITTIQSAKALITAVQFAKVLTAGVEWTNPRRRNFSGS
jgi:hypothetical protein